ncbi:unnamed protein product [Penicillium roqueforti FM164]|uniref:Genomic scaffold, ProqFM164S04 n=1 Tax=Penicillium roqueforti (strain FM164) TaxID=1365484 RepID=W6R2E2_PENRF|nr:unnamed protein product [Penicillium roqueforti FM164]
MDVPWTLIENDILSMPTFKMTAITADTTKYKKRVRAELFGDAITLKPQNEA